MKLALIGLPGAGEKTLFGILSGKPVDEKGQAVVSGKAAVYDSRLDRLAEFYKPKRVSPASCELLLATSLTEGAQNAGVFENIIGADVICCVVRGDMAHDLRYIIDELILNDLLVVEERLVRVEDKDLLSRMKGHLEEGLSLRTFEFTPDEQKSLKDYLLLSIKPAVVVLNTEGEEAPGSCEALKEDFSGQSLKWQEMKASRGLPGLACRAAGLVSFFTVNDKEGRAWRIPSGTPAPLAARSVHRDMEKGFIRVDVMTYSDFESGQRSTITKGKDYVVEDGDILKFLFKV